MPATGPGTLMFAVQADIVRRLQERLVDARVGYEPPRGEGDLQTDQGIEDAIWFAVGDQDGADASITYTVPVFHGPYSATNPLWLDEEVVFTVVCQAVRRDGTQADADARAGQLLADVLAVLTTRPDVTDSETAQLLSFDVLPQACTVRRGYLPGSDGHACQCRIDVRASSRLKLT